MPTSELVKVSVTPQGTADVYIGELHIKTFGGPVAHQAASDFAAAIRAEFNKTKTTPEYFNKTKDIPEYTDILDGISEYPKYSGKPECDKCFEEEGSYTCIRAAHKLGDKANVQSETRKPRQ